MVTNAAIMAPTNCEAIYKAPSLHFIPSCFLTIAIVTAGFTCPPVKPPDQHSAINSEQEMNTG